MNIQEIEKKGKLFTPFELPNPRDALTESSNYIILSPFLEFDLKKEKEGRKRNLKSYKNFFFNLFYLFLPFIFLIWQGHRSLTLRHHRSLGQLVTCFHTQENVEQENF